MLTARQIAAMDFTHIISFKPQGSPVIRGMLLIPFCGEESKAQRKNLLELRAQNQELNFRVAGSSAATVGDV